MSESEGLMDVVGVGVVCATTVTCGKPVRVVRVRGIVRRLEGASWQERWKQMVRIGNIVTNSRAGNSEMVKIRNTKPIGSQAGRRKCHGVAVWRVYIAPREGNGIDLCLMGWLHG